MKTFYTDGACSGNPGPGGWAVILLENDTVTRKWGGFQNNTTNNRMELTAVIEVLKHLGSGKAAAIFTDSEYVRKGITEWMKNWKLKNWMTTGKKPVKNRDLWELLDSLNHRDIQWHYVAGHSGDYHNDMCDRIARQFISTKQVWAVVE
ncbi:ribonuclease HI [bacterium]|nr:ribonuclease HI [bacterium]MBU1874845.1 ribonuclease HI [bacterium]